MDKKKRILNFVDYAEALDWIKDKSKDYKSMNDFYASDEYKSAYPLISKMHEVEQDKFAKKAKDILKKSGLAFGDKVRYEYISPFFDVTKYTGTIVDRKGIPYVKLDDNQKTMSGKKSIRWHKGFVKI